MLCENCGEREATRQWAEGGALAITHGFIQNWCAVCVLEAQIAYARNAASRLPELEAQLAEQHSGGEGAK